MTTDLVLDAVEHAFFTRALDGTSSLRGLIAHSDYAEVCVKPRICGDGLCSWGLLADFSALRFAVIADCRGFGVGLR
jgi:hypothetical protein